MLKLLDCLCSDLRWSNLKVDEKICYVIKIQILSKSTKN